MTKWSLKALDRGFAGRLLSSKSHNIQSSLPWLDFLRAFSHEEDRSITVYRHGEPVGFFCALQYRNLIQSLPFPASYAGLQTSEQLSSGEEREVYDALFAHYSRYCDVVSVCTTPFFSNSRLAEPCFDFTASSEVHYIDLKEEPLARTSSKFRNNLRRNLRKAEQAEVRIGHSTTHRDIDAWHDCYVERMAELRGTILPTGYFRTMFDQLQTSGNCSLITATIGARFLGGIITIQNEYCCDYYLSMFNREGAESQASTAALHYLIAHARQSGIALLNLQASPRNQADLVRFKESWGARQARHSYLVKVINNREVIEHLSPHIIRKDYEFHYLIPFDALKPVVSYA